MSSDELIHKIMQVAAEAVLELSLIEAKNERMQAAVQQACAMILTEKGDDINVDPGPLYRLLQEAIDP